MRLWDSADMGNCLFQHLSQPLSSCFPVGQRLERETLLFPGLLAHSSGSGCDVEPASQMRFRETWWYWPHGLGSVSGRERLEPAVLILASCSTDADKAVHSENQVSMTASRSFAEGV